jgi:hypothetical protein
MDLGPALLTVVLQAGHIGAEEWSKLSSTTGTLTFVTQLIIKYVRLHLDLQPQEQETGHWQ